MSDKPYTITGDPTEEIELLLARFERDRQSGPVELSDYTPASDDEAYAAVVTELARIDLERGCDEGVLPVASRYFDEFPGVFAQPHYRTQVAFEEYRLRRQMGQDVSSGQIGSQYEVDGSRWPTMRLGSADFPSQRSHSRRYTEADLKVAPVHYPAVGQTFAGYPLVSRIGEGAFSRVFLARQPDLAGRLVVLKLTPLATDESDRLARLQHAAIIPVYSVHREDDLSCICMPYLGATTLADLSAYGERWASLNGPAEELISTILDRRRSTVAGVGPPTGTGDGRRKIQRAADSDSGSLIGSSDCKDSCFAQANSLAEFDDKSFVQFSGLGYADALVDLVARAVEGLAHAHRRGIIHRDLKPANVLVTDDGNPVLLDFNLAVSAQDPKARIVGGTLPYMSPEQLGSLESGETADMRDDVFSVGVILYELLTGKLPFACPRSGEEFELAAVIANRKRTPKSIRAINSSVSVGLSAIIARCIAPTRDQRYQDASDLLEDLNRHREHRPLKYAPNQSLRERFFKFSARHPRFSSASTVATLAAVMLMAISLLVWQRNERIAQLEIETQWTRTTNEMPRAVMLLSSQGREQEILEEGLLAATPLIRRWNIDEAGRAAHPDISRLSRDKRDSLFRDLGRLAVLMARAEEDLGVQGIPSNRPKHLEQAVAWNRVAAQLMPELQSFSDFQIRQVTLKLDAANADLPPAPTTDVADIIASADLETRLLWASRHGDATLQRELADELTRDNPTSVTGWYYAAGADMVLGDFENAIARFDVCNRMRPRSLSTLFNRGVCNLHRNRPDLARDDFSQCLRIKTTLSEARFNRAVAEFRLANYSMSLEDLNHVVSNSIGSPRMLLLRARVHAALGDSQAAAEDRVAALKMTPRDAQDWVSLGFAKLKTSPQLALADFEAALRIEPGQPEAIVNAAYVYSEILHQPQRGIELLTQLIDRPPRLPSAVASRAILQARLGNTADALADASTASQLAPGAREQLQIAGVYALVSAETQDESLENLAIQWLARALRTDSNFAAIAMEDPDLANLHNDPRFKRLIGSGLTIESAAR